MKHVIRHGLDHATALKMAHAALRSYAHRFEKYSAAVKWMDEVHAVVTFKAKGLDTRGSFTLLPGALQIEMEVPLLLRPFQGQAVGAVEEEVSRWVALARAGKLDDEATRLG